MIGRHGGCFALGQTKRRRMERKARRGVRTLVHPGNNLTSAARKLREQPPRLDYKRGVRSAGFSPSPRNCNLHPPRRWCPPGPTTVSCPSPSSSPNPETSTAPAAMSNRHGLVAGATGTREDGYAAKPGRGFSAQGVPVIPRRRQRGPRGNQRAGGSSPKVRERVRELGLQDYTPTDSRSPSGTSSARADIRSAPPFGNGPGCWRGSCSSMKPRAGFSTRVSDRR